MLLLQGPTFTSLKTKSKTHLHKIYATSFCLRLPIVLKAITTAEHAWILLFFLTGPQNQWQRMASTKNGIESLAVKVDLYDDMIAY